MTRRLIVFANGRDPVRTPYHSGKAEYRRNLEAADMWFELLVELKRLIRNSPKSRRISRQWTETRRRTRTRTRSRR